MFRFYPFFSLLLAWLPAILQAQVITAFSPASGNVGTPVTLTGTGLNLVTAEALNGTPGIILNQTSTSMCLLVMPGATTGTTYASIGLQFATQRAKLPSLAFLSDINSLLNFRATRNDLLIPLVAPFIRQVYREVVGR